MNSIKLDLKDNKILKLITENAKLPSKSIAKEVGLTREAVDYRIKRLENTGIISQYVTKIDMTRFCQNAYMMFLRMSKITPLKFNKVTNFFIKDPLTMWVSSLSGEWDLATSFLTKDSLDLTKKISDVENVLGENLREYGLLTYTREIKNTYEDLFLPKERKTFDNKFMMREFSRERFVNLDTIDKKIVTLLAKNAKISNKEIAKEVGLTEEAVRQRIKNLEKTEVIRGYRAIIDIYKLNLEIYYVLMKFTRVDSLREKEIDTYFNSHPNVYYCARTAGRYDLIACITAKDRMHFHEILTEMRNRFSSILKEFSTNVIFKEYKHIYLPEGVLN